MTTDIKDKTQILTLVQEINSGGLHSYDDQEQSLVFNFESNGGEREDCTLTLRFIFVEYFHLPLSLDAASINGYGIDEIRVASEKEAKAFMPSVCYERMNYKKNDYRCYRFYANGEPSPFYIYCLDLEASLVN